MPQKKKHNQRVQRRVGLQLQETIMLANALKTTAIAAHRIVQLGLNGEQLGAGANPGVFTADNGDALYWITDQAVGSFVITGGKGRFCGAAGTGTATGTPNPATGEITFAWDGMIQVPQI